MKTNQTDLQASLILKEILPLDIEFSLDGEEGTSLSYIYVEERRRINSSADTYKCISICRAIRNSIQCNISSAITI